MSFEEMIEQEERTASLAMNILSGKADMFSHLEVDDDYDCDNMSRISYQTNRAYTYAYSQAVC